MGNETNYADALIADGLKAIRDLLSLIESDRSSSITVESGIDTVVFMEQCAPDYDVRTIEANVQDISLRFLYAMMEAKAKDMGYRNANIDYGVVTVTNAEDGLQYVRFMFQMSPLEFVFWLERSVWKGLLNAA